MSEPTTIQNCYVRMGGFAHRNTAESLFSIFKRGVIGTYHYMSEAHSMPSASPVGGLTDSPLIITSRPSRSASAASAGLARKQVALFPAH